MGDDDKKKKHEEIIETAKKRFKLGLEADSENREKAIEDMKFRAGDQWPEQIKRNRESDSRPCLTVNKIPQNVHQITNDQRQNRPAIKVNPFDDNADPDTASVIQGLIRNIQNNSHADTAYDIAFDAAVTGGRGYFRITTEFSDPLSFNKDIKIKSIHDPHSVVLDPSYREPDGSDANWGFIFEDIPLEDFKAQYPNAEASKDTFDWKDQSGDWFSEESAKVAEYFEKVCENKEICLLSNGKVVLKSQLDKLSEEEKEVMAQQDITVVKERKSPIPTVKWYKINGEEILDETEWPSKYIPIIPIHGVELFVEGKRVFEGIIRHAKDPQRMYNYFASCEAESIALSPRAPYIGAEGQFEGHEDKWNNAHTKNYTYLEYKPKTLNGQLAGPPQRNFGEPNVQSITQARMLASDDLKSTTGIYDASLGNRSNEQSGVAIQRRASQSQTGNFHFIDNLSRSLAHTGRILIELIPVIYDTARVIRILGEDDEQKIVKVNERFRNKDGEEKIYDFSVGKYDVTVSTGPSYATKRQEAVASMLELTRYNQQVAQVAGDLLIKNMDWPGADEIANRIKKTIAPEILGEDGNKPIPPEVKGQLDQLGQMVEQLTAKLNEAQDKLDNKTIEIESKERIEMAKLNTQIQIKAAEFDSRYGATPEELSHLFQAVNTLKERLELLEFGNPIDQDEIAESLEGELNSDQVNPPQQNNLPGEMSPAQTNLPVDGE